MRRMFWKVDWHRRAIEAATMPAACRALWWLRAASARVPAGCPSDSSGLSGSLCVSAGRTSPQSRSTPNGSLARMTLAQPVVGHAIGGGLRSSNPRPALSPGWRQVAGIVAASMARRCQTPSQNIRRIYQASRRRGSGETAGRGEEGRRPQAFGMTLGQTSPPTPDRR